MAVHSNALVETTKNLATIASEMNPTTGIVSAVKNGVNALSVNSIEDCKFINSIEYSHGNFQNKILI